MKVYIVKLCGSRDIDVAEEQYFDSVLSHVIVYNYLMKEHLDLKQPPNSDADKGLLFGANFIFS